MTNVPYKTIKYFRGERGLNKPSRGKQAENLQHCVPHEFEVRAMGPSDFACATIGV
jgi:hypothetical protein